MYIEFAFPLVVLTIKLAFKLFVGHTLDRVTTAKTFIAFPVDVAFTAFSFGAASLSHGSDARLDARAVIAMTLAGVAIALFITWCTREAERAFDRDAYWPVVLLTGLGYLLSFVLVTYSSAIGTMA